MISLLIRPLYSLMVIASLRFCSTYWIMDVDIHLRAVCFALVPESMVPFSPYGFRIPGQVLISRICHISLSASTVPIVRVLPPPAGVDWAWQSLKPSSPLIVAMFGLRVFQGRGRALPSLSHLCLYRSTG